MADTREQIIERMAKALNEDAYDFPEECAGDIELAETQASDVLPVAVKAITDRVREGLRKPDRLLHPWKTCACSSCDDYRYTSRLLDRIDAEMGVPR